MNILINPPTSEELHNIPDTPCGDCPYKRKWRAVQITLVLLLPASAIAGAYILGWR